MTTQSSDPFIYKDEKYSIAGINNDLHFDPEEHGVTLGRDTLLTSCYRGYICTYALEDKQLMLKDLGIVSTPTGKLNGVKATKHRDKSSRCFYYRSANIQINYTGGIIIARDSIPEFNFHMGYSPAWTYKTVIELTFKDGKLEKVHHASDAAAEYRMRFVNRKKGPTRSPSQEEIHRRQLKGESMDTILPGAGYEDTRKWIEDTFTLKYK